MFYVIQWKQSFHIGPLEGRQLVSLLLCHPSAGSGPLSACWLVSQFDQQSLIWGIIAVFPEIKKRSANRVTCILSGCCASSG